MAVTEPRRMVLRFADLGIATYGSLRVIGHPELTVTWVIEAPILLAALQELADAVPDARPGETPRDALERAVAHSAFTTPQAELTLAYVLGVLLIAAPAWQLLIAGLSEPRAALFISPTARLARVPWGLLAMPTSGPTARELVHARAEAMTRTGPVAARIPWQLTDVTAHTEGHRLMELADVFMTVPPSIVAAPRNPASWADRRDAPPLLVLDPRVPGQRPDSALGSVLGKPADDTPVVRHFAESMRRRPVLPETGSAVELFRRPDADRGWLAGQLRRSPSRLLYVGHATAADDDAGRADRSALHLAESAPLTAAELIGAALPVPPRVALLACASGADYRFDEAAGLVAAMVLGGAQTVTATLWSLPTTRGYRQFAGAVTDPMADVIIAVDSAHDETAAGCAVNRWQRAQMRRWRDGDVTASPLYWAALATFAVDGAR
jgi:hypothetical protein